MDRLERVARAMCIASGLDPDRSTFSKICPGERIWNLFEEQAQAAIDELEQWRQIDTAPEDTEVLVYRPDGIQKTDVMMRVDDYWYWPDGESPTTHPTHWLPLPSPPK